MIEGSERTREERLGSQRLRGEPPRACRKPPESRQRPLKGLDYLEADNAAVQALGIPVEVAQALGIGYAKKGIMRGRICIPLRDASGNS
jgi:hypothetical protein